MKSQSLQIGEYKNIVVIFGEEMKKLMKNDLDNIP